MIDYATLEQAYQEATKDDEPNLMLIRPWPKSRIMKRRLGRLVRRGLAHRGDVLHCINYRGVWCGVVIV